MIADATIEPGHWVALAMTSTAVGGYRCWIGQVQAVDEHGVRLTQADGATGRPSGFDVYAAWPSIAGALVATKDHFLDQFGDESIRFGDGCGRDERPTPLVTT